MNKKILSVIFSVFMFSTLVFGVSNSAFCNTKNTKPAQSVQSPIINAAALNIVANPNKYLGKTVRMQATFDKFSTLGLDYSKAKRESSKYIGILIQRDDVLDHDVPLSEMKLFMKKEMAEKHIDLDTGDKIELTAKVFSTALNDPWLDIESLKVIKKVQKEEK